MSDKSSGANEKRRIRGFRRFILAIIDCFVVAGLAIGSYWMVNWGIYYHPAFSTLVGCWIAGNILLALILFLFFNLYFMEFASASIIDSIHILLSVLSLGCANALFVSLIDRKVYHLGYGVVLVYCLMLFIALLATRFSKRIFNVISNFWCS